MRLVKDKKYPDMYRIQWPNGDLSSGTVNPKPWEKGGIYGFYNKTRAKEILKRPGVENYKRYRIYNSPLARINDR